MCAFALTIPRTAPNYLCREEAASSLRGQWLDNGLRSNVISAEVRMENGKDTYSDLRINGKPVSGDIDKHLPQHSVGEFTNLMGALFSPQAGAEFKFAKETRLHGADALLFNFTVHRATNKGLWYLHIGDKVFFPGYRGVVTVNREHEQLMRIEMHATELEHVPIVSHTVTLDFSDVPLGDGTSFVLPVRSTFENCENPQRCIFNESTFHGCRKFGANSRIIASP